MILNTLALIFLLSSVQGFILAFVLFLRQRMLYASRFLALLIFAYSLFLFAAFLMEADFFERYPRLLFVAPGLPLLFGPLHYLYAYYLTHPENHRFRSWQLLHFLPFVVYRLLLIRDMIRPSEQIIAYLKGLIEREPSLADWFFDGFLVLQGLTYMVITIYLLLKYQNSIREAFSALERINLNWLKRITYLATVVWLLILFKDVLHFFGYSVWGELHIEAVFTAVYVYALGYLGLFKAEIFAGAEIQNALAAVDKRQESASLKYIKSGLQKDAATKYLKQLQELMQDNKPYRQQDLTLQQLSELLHITPHNLSEILNRHLHKSFYDYINDFRVEQVKTDLTNPKKQHLTLLALALDAGFNSKSSFNSIFKKHTGMTPTAYRLAHIN